MNKSAIPNLVVGFTRGRIRVPKRALRMMGCPNYIRLLINTEERYVAIAPGEEGDSKSYRVPDYIYTSGSSFEVSSLALIQQIKLYCEYGADIHVCSLKPRACLDNHFVIFSFPEEDQNVE